MVYFLGHPNTDFEKEGLREVHGHGAQEWL